MKTLYMTKGLPASGKSTWAREMITRLKNVKRVNKDELRALLDDGKHSKSNEKFVLEVRDSIVIQALTAGLHVIVDDTNLATKHEARLRQIAQQTGAAFEVVDLFLDVDVDECVARDKKRPNYVGEDVIRGMYAQFLRPGPPEVDSNKPWVIICDVDGTVMKMGERGPFDWHRVEEDEPRLDVWHAVVGVQANCRPRPYIAFVSGRSDECYAGTVRSLRSRLMVEDPQVFMRPVGDNRNDAIVKREIYEQYIAPRFNVRAIFDDRPRVIRMWQSLGFADRIFNVGDGREF